MLRVAALHSIDLNDHGLPLFQVLMRHFQLSMALQRQNSILERFPLRAEHPTELLTEGPFWLLGMKARGILMYEMKTAIAEEKHLCIQL